MNHTKGEKLNFLRNVNMVFHFGDISVQEKNILVQDAKTGFLSKATESMLREKIKNQPENGFLSEILDYFRKENETC